MFLVLFIIIVIACIACSGGDTPYIPPVKENNSAKAYQTYSKEDIAYLREQIMNDYYKNNR